jgi:hypothetical protein
MVVQGQGGRGRYVWELGGAQQKAKNR